MEGRTPVRPQQQDLGQPKGGRTGVRPYKTMFASDLT